MQKATNNHLTELLAEFNTPWSIIWMHRRGGEGITPSGTQANGGFTLHCTALTRCSPPFTWDTVMLLFPEVYRFVELHGVTRASSPQQQPSLQQVTNSDPV